MQAEEATKMDDTGPGDAADVRRRTKGAIVEAALTHAAFDGWTDDTVLYAAAECEVDSRTARRLFPRGGKDLLRGDAAFGARHNGEALQRHRIGFHRQ